MDTEIQNNEANYIVYNSERASYFILAQPRVPSSELLLSYTHT
jgi:hypothetical protein